MLENICEKKKRIDKKLDKHVNNGFSGYSFFCKNRKTVKMLVEIHNAKIK